MSTSLGTHEYPGGSPANVAYGLSKLGAGTALWTALGDDRLGDILRSHLTGAGVEVLDWAKPLASTSTAKVQLAEDGSAEYDFSVDLTIQERPLPVLPALLHVGSAAAFTDPGCRAVEDAACSAQARASLPLTRTSGRN
ncbi:PfkB family carbohydrate kinase [Arthrobacter psychrolactophilus]